MLLEQKFVGGVWVSHGLVILCGSVKGPGLHLCGWPQGRCSGSGSSRLQFMQQHIFSLASNAYIVRVGADAKRPTS